MANKRQHASHDIHITPDNHSIEDSIAKRTEANGAACQRGGVGNNKKRKSYLSLVALGSFIIHTYIR